MRYSSEIALGSPNHHSDCSRHEVLLGKEKQDAYLLYMRRGLSSRSISRQKREYNSETGIMSNETGDDAKPPCALSGSGILLMSAVVRGMGSWHWRNCSRLQAFPSCVEKAFTTELCALQTILFASGYCICVAGEPGHRQ